MRLNYFLFLLIILLFFFFFLIIIKRWVLYHTIILLMIKSRVIFNRPGKLFPQLIINSYIPLTALQTAGLLLILCLYTPPISTIKIILLLLRPMYILFIMILAVSFISSFRCCFWLFVLVFLTSLEIIQRGIPMALIHLIWPLLIIKCLIPCYLIILVIIIRHWPRLVPISSFATLTSLWQFWLRIVLPLIVGFMTVRGVEILTVYFFTKGVRIVIFVIKRGSRFSELG